MAAGHVKKIHGEKQMEGKKEFWKDPKVEIALVALLLLGGIFIRAYHFGMIPIGVHQDEAMAAVDAKALADYGTDRFGMRYPVHFTAWIGGQMSVLLSYCMVPFIKILGFSTVSIRLPMLIVSCAGLLALYLFARHLTGKWFAIGTLLLGIICPWHYMQSRWSFDCNMFPHVFLFGVCLLLAGLRRRGCLYGSMIFFGLSSYCYGIANYSVPLFLLAMAIYLAATGLVKGRELAVCVILYVLVALPEFLTMLINVLGVESIETPFFTIPYFPQSMRSKDILFLQFSWEQLWKNLAWAFSAVWGNGDKSITNTIVRFGPIYYLTTLFFVIGFLDLIRKIRKEEKEKKAPFVILLAWLIMGIWVGAVTKEVTINRINIIFYPVLAAAGMGIVWCIRKCRLAVIPIAGAYMVLALLFAVNYFGGWADISRDYYYEPYINALNYAKEQAGDYYCITPDPQGEGVSMVGQILTMYCHEIDAHYYQGISNVQDGREVVPYEQRYCFQDATEEMVAENEQTGKDVVYIVRAPQVELFSADRYEICSFYDAFFVVTQK
jgi:4-amino-4-deoxy-L-arabinose transferase-like glycosyltransferase